MSLTALAGAVARQWVFFALLVVAGAAGAVAVGSQVPQTYETRASIILLGPSSYVDSDGVTVRVNPYARAGGAGEGITASTTLAVLMSPQTVEEAWDDGFPGEYQISLSPLGGAILDLVVTSETPTGALDGLDILIGEVESTVLDRQEEAGAPEDSLVRATLLTRSTEADTLSGARLRAAGATGALALLVALLATAGLDRARRPRGTGAPDGAPAADRRVAAVRDVRQVAPRASRTLVVSSRVSSRGDRSDAGSLLASRPDGSDALNGLRGDRLAAHPPQGAGTGRLAPVNGVVRGEVAEGPTPDEPVPVGPRGAPAP